MTDQATTHDCCEGQGVFPVASDPVYADDYFSQPVKLYVENPESVGFPLDTPLYFSAAVNDAATSACQFAWNAEETWSRTGAFQRDVNQGTEVIFATATPTGGSATSGSLIIMATGGPLSGVFYPGLLDLREQDATSLKGQVQFALANFTDGTVTFGDKACVSYQDGQASVLVSEVAFGTGRLEILGAQFNRNRIEIDVAYVWTSYGNPYFVWHGWNNFGGQAEPQPDVFTTVSTADANAYTTAAVKLHVDGSGQNFPVAAPLYFVVMVDDQAATATQTAWAVGGDMIYFRTWTRASGSFSAWQSYRGRQDFVPLAGGYSRSNYETRPVQSGITDLTLNANSANLINLTVMDSLAIAAQALDRQLHKLITLNLQADTDTTLNWPDEMLWPQGDKPFTMPRGRQLIVEVRLGNGMLVGKVEAVKQLPPSGDGEGLFVLLGTRATDGQDQPGIAFGNDIANLEIVDLNYPDVYSLMLAQLRRQDGMYVTAGWGGLVGYGYDLDNLTLVKTEINRFGKIVCRESDGMILASEGQLGANAAIAWGIPPGSLSTMQVSNSDIHSIACRQADGMFLLTTRDGNLGYGTDPANLTFKKLPMTGLPVVQCRQSDGMICVVMGGPAIMFAGYNPAELMEYELPAGSSGLSVIRESDGILLIVSGSGAKYSLMYGSDFSSLETAPIPTEMSSTVRNIAVNQKTGSIYLPLGLGGTPPGLAYGPHPDQLEAIWHTDSNLNVSGDGLTAIAINEAKDEAVFYTYRSVNGVREYGLSAYSDHDGLTFISTSPFSGSPQWYEID